MSIDKTLVDKFASAYNEVFNQDGTVKNCGRSKCSELIEIGNRISYSTCGNATSGIMDIEELHRLRSMM